MITKENITGEGLCAHKFNFRNLERRNENTEFIFVMNPADHTSKSVNGTI